MNRVLLHVCCGNCACFPLEVLKEKGYSVTAFWYNPNIHPLSEYRKRMDAFLAFTDSQGIEAIRDESYSVREFIGNLGGELAFPKRCAACWALRLRETAKTAKERGFGSFTTTLLYSIYQDNGLIRKIGEETAGEYGLEFYYSDFRSGWQKGIDISKKLGLYRQNYCGCIFSEEERNLKHR
ncbi:hypothetical protein COY52_06515 [Candidatus Desantisbacteria bacterium CG_4_10_14_0_8_um_filter_48_22]|uniref:Epoxyqueuosine reductase QueH n=1 Tax=Candidatus Desantisbacteria bacterium CG_4_10_14_0_8_um_filter_48_22 TaxID=1974543 RepID=A0A2M7SB42_9BACT|nr:MAG: hypothetical protein AUJ67_05350 [Candidatus Desantisbacteria bacterium CG1_02_49_89]PIV55764.1 MAG: hypothetical protein COS16_06110 [Candidatus Desantisbacteria bacterium CG02_land_8_20_14_3_00_49_13]PIZ16690.1 MAG: hypothetical protein COY52_06515 [Candidatus Desantisbacteria bacterium CG_4_10_14_0_8_um_filter_48_22]PJB28172.1 MAG: hypothetical protein CO111_02275 [Candidatus Desantisbacteria bacterium CG_4_9_14_3_um_filter_50_7]